MRDGAAVTDPVINDGTANYTPGLSERRSSATKFVQADLLGSMTLLTNSSQATTDTRQYDAFGMSLATSGTTATPFDFAGGRGYQSDGDSALVLLGHRYYDASTGRFLSRDPAMSWRNWYAYANNAPTLRTDSSGYQADDDDGGDDDDVFDEGLLGPIIRGFRPTQNADDDTEAYEKWQDTRSGPDQPDSYPPDEVKLPEIQGGVPLWRCMSQEEYDRMLADMAFSPSPFNSGKKDFWPSWDMAEEYFQTSKLGYSHIVETGIDAKYLEGPYDLSDVKGSYFYQVPDDNLPYLWPAK